MTRTSRKRKRTKSRKEDKDDDDNDEDDEGADGVDVKKQKMPRQRSLSPFLWHNTHKETPAPLPLQPSPLHTLSPVRSQVRLQATRGEG